jgi:hypothetical protein
MIRFNRVGFSAFLSLTVAVTCSATTLGYFDLDKSVKYSEIIAIADLKSVKPVMFDDGSSRVCGYAIHMIIDEGFKPSTQHGDFTFFSSSDGDILKGYSKYFVMIYQRQSASSEITIDGKKCDTRGISYAVNRVSQTVFPIESGPDGKPLYLLVSRHNPFFSGSMVSSNNKYIHLFGIQDDRLYGFASWEIVSRDVRQLIDETSKDGAAEQ